MTDNDPITRLNAALEGRYRIESELGEGGMATVYLADDIKHERKVALKVLKPELAAVVGAERFLAEIKTTANLQHPHILPLFDSGEADSFLFYVMPYVEGETLGDRLAREHQLPVADAVHIVTNVAEALDYAHSQGVIHRDIKPANILLQAGKPVISDFGIALAVGAAGGGRLTETGLSLGTPHYMSPEQATGDLSVGAASDTYALGCVLYEMLVGEPPYTGSTAQAILGKIIAGELATATKQRASVPANVDAAIRKALEKVPADRFTGVQDFANALADPGFRHGERSAMPGSGAGTGWRGFSVAMSAIAATAVVVAVWSFRTVPATERPPPFRMELSDFVVETTNGGGWRIAISRDGATLVAGGADDLLYLRRSDDTEFRPIPGTKFGRNPSISPDGKWVVFSQGGVLNKVQVAGGSVLPVTNEGGSPHWFSQEEIIYSASGGAFRVNAAGGEGTQLVEDTGGRPFMLPGGRALLGDGPEGLYLNDLETGRSRLVAAGGSNGRYLRTGHILFGDLRSQSVLAVPFDLETLEATGTPVPVLPSVNIFGGGAVQLAVSDNGTLVHGISPTTPGGAARLSWVEMDGTRTDLPLEIGQGQVLAPRISPDGTRLAYQDAVASEIIVYDFNTGERTQLTEDQGPVRHPAWAPDGSRVYYSTTEGWYRKTVDGVSTAEQIGTDPWGLILAVSPDEDWIVIEDGSGMGAPDLVVARLGSDPVESRTYLRADWHEEVAVVSPDGEWLAYVSSEGDEHMVYIRSFPDPGPAVQVSSGFGNDPTWASDGSAVYYRGSGAMMRREVRWGDSVELGEELAMFSLAGTLSSSSRRMHDIHPDGDRFIFVTNGEIEVAPDLDGEGIGPVVVVTNWFTELTQRMGGN